jgi:hypothetical protein
MIFRMQRNSAALRTAPRPKLIGADRFVFGKNKASGILLPNAQAELENPLFLPMKIPCSAKTNSLFW